MPASSFHTHFFTPLSLFHFSQSFLPPLSFIPAARHYSMLFILHHVPLPLFLPYIPLVVNNMSLGILLIRRSPYSVEYYFCLSARRMNPRYLTNRSLAYIVLSAPFRASVSELPYISVIGQIPAVQSPQRSDAISINYIDYRVSRAPASRMSCGCRCDFSFGQCQIPALKQVVSRLLHVSLGSKGRLARQKSELRA